MINGASFWFGNGAGIKVGPYTAAFKATVISRGGSLTTNELKSLTTFETSLGSDITEFDRLWIHGLSNSVAARTSFVNPSSTAITAVNSPTFTANVGYNGNGTTSYLNLNFIPSTQAVKFSQNSASFGFYCGTNLDAVNVSLGSYDTQFTQIRALQSGLSYGYLFDTAGVGVTASLTDSFGLYSIKRVNTTVDLYKRGVFKSTSGVVASSVPTITQFALCRNANGTADSLDTRINSLTFYASGSVNQLNFYNAVQALGTSIGWAK